MQQLTIVNLSRTNRQRFSSARWQRVVITFLCCPLLLTATTLSNPEVDHYNLRMGTQAFGSQYQFATHSLLEETPYVIREMGSDIIKLALSSWFPKRYGITLPATITNLTSLVRDEPSYRKVFDMPFRHYMVWADCFSTRDRAYWRTGLTPDNRQAEYTEIYTLTKYLLTTYNGSGKHFYLGHWEGDWFLLPKNADGRYNTTTNPTPVAIQGMRDWLSIRQQAVDDARIDIAHTNVNVFVYTEVNRVRDAMVNGTNSNQRLVNAVLPAVTNLDYVSWSSYDGQNLSPADLTATLDYIESQLSTNKASVIPGRRVFVGEYGWGGTLSSDAQEPPTREYLQRLMTWGTPFMLFWEIYNNEPGKEYWLIDDEEKKTPCYYLHQRFFNAARLILGEFQQSYTRLPDNAEFESLMTPLLDDPLPEPVSLALINLPATNVLDNASTVSGALTQGVYGESEARAFICYGTVDGGTNRAAWQQVVDLGLNSQFGEVPFSTTLTNLQSSQLYYFRFHATNDTATGWSQASTTFTTLPRTASISIQTGQ